MLLLHADLLLGHGGHLGSLTGESGLWTEGGTARRKRSRFLAGFLSRRNLLCERNWSCFRCILTSKSQHTALVGPRFGPARRTVVRDGATAKRVRGDS